MGNSQSDSHFDADAYVKHSGLTKDEVIGIRNVFESLEPKNEVIQTGTLRKLYRDSYDAPQLNSQIGSRETLTFNQFFELMQADMIKKKQQFPDIYFDDGRTENVQCFFCQPTREQR